MIYPKIVQEEPEAIQKMYLCEYQRVFDRTGNHMDSIQSANALLGNYKTDEFEELEELQEVTMTATICELSATDVIPESVLNSIKLVDKHPFFAVYNIGEVGISTGSLDGVDHKKLWSFSAIKELASKIKNGANIILGHTDGEEKMSMGEIVHSFTKKLDKGLTALAVAWIRDDKTKERIKNGELDTCSIEGNVMLAKTAPDKPWYVKAVDSIKSLAIANSKDFTPGFAGAGIKARIQELETVKEKDMAKEQISMVDVKTFIAEHNTPIEELYSKRDIVDTNDVKDFLEKEKGKLSKESETILNGIKDKNNELMKFKDKVEIKNYVNDSKHLASSDEKTINYIRTRLDLAFSDDLGDDKKKELVDESIEKELKLISDMGITFNDKKEELAQDTDQPLDEQDFADPDVNDLIPK